MDHRAIHEPNCSEDGRGPDGKLVLSKEREQRPMLKAYRLTARDRPAHIGPRDARHGGGGGGDRQTCTGSLKRRQAVNIHNSL